MNEKTVARFRSKVDKDGPVPAHCPELGPCWVWMACDNGHGYGSFWFDGKRRTAHRVAWDLKRGAIPEGLCVLHHCDNPCCVRPDHLFLGTNADNMADMVGKGRSDRGESRYNAKLDGFTVRIIRRLNRRGLAQRMIARVFGVSQSVVSKVCLGDRWGHLL